MSNYLPEQFVTEKGFLSSLILNVDFSFPEYSDSGERDGPPGFPGKSLLYGLKEALTGSYGVEKESGALVKSPGEFSAGPWRKVPTIEKNFHFRYIFVSIEKVLIEMIFMANRGLFNKRSPWP
ncbi:MAG: hypothetical protein JXR72_08260 [Proteobacteria bacterium]|nr:hypothetical protein [Pseudomonadota bacterium]